jgi:hypothetical protein
MATRKSTQNAEAEAQAAEEMTKTTKEMAEAGKDAGAAAADAATEAAGNATEASEMASEEIASATDRAIDSVMIGQQQAVQTFEASSHAMVEGVTRIQREIVEFVSERIRHDMATQQELMRCRSLDEIRAVQTRFFQTAMDQYSAEATKLMRMGQEMLQKSLARAD